MKADKIDARKIDFQEFFYEGGDLGVDCNHNRTNIRIWAPVADKVDFLIFSDDCEDSLHSIRSLKKGVNGTWKLKLSGDWSGYYYLFRIHYGERFEDTLDPYAKAVGLNSERGLIINLSETNPQGWHRDKRKKIENPAEAIIYELHIRDFSSCDYSGMKQKGTYLAFTEEGVINEHGEKTGIAHLKELGITHVHLLPVFDFGSVCDQDRNYNWGYDPFLYNVPEGSYASDPTDETRIKEFKSLVKSLHDNDIGVIIDVVYNHTYHGKYSVFQKIAPNYFYRFVDDYFANGSGCGNEIATERPMVRKFIIDSVCYWAKEYHIDGFRFDLMGLIDKKTMKMVVEALHKIDSSIIIYGEPWTALDPQLDWDKRMNKGAQKGTKVALFNDDFRNAIKDSLIRSQEKKWDIKKGVVGAIGYDHGINNFAYKTTEAVNYVSCHDNLTLWDEISIAQSHLSKEERIKMHRLAQAVILTSQGIPFIQGGSEFLRTKHFNGNSYDAGDDCNRLKWKRKSKHKNTFEYYKGLIKLRKKHPAFKMTDPGQVRRHLQFINAPYNAVGFKLMDHANGDSWKEILVLYNFNRHWSKFYLEKEKELGIVVDDQRSGTEIFNSFKANNVEVPPISVMVLKLL